MINERDLENIKSTKDFYTKFAPTEEKAVEYVENIRWEGHTHCPYCNKDNVYKCKDVKRPYKCRDCNLKFSVKTGTIMQGSNLPVQQWLYVMYIMYTNKKGISSIRLAEELGVTQKTAWFMSQKIRECFSDNTTKLEGTVEIDATFVGGKEKNKHESKRLHENHATGKTAVMGAISRDNKQVIAYPTGEESRDTAEKFIYNRIEKGSMIYADNSKAYNGLVALRVNHGRKEYVRGNIHTNSIESFWATVKRGYIGTFHHWSDKHMKRYINEFSFRYNNRRNGNISFLNNIISNGLGKIRTYNYIKGVI